MGKTYVFPWRETPKRTFPQGKTYVFPMYLHGENLGVGLALPGGSAPDKIPEEYMMFTWGKPVGQVSDFFPWRIHSEYLTVSWGNVP